MSLPTISNNEKKISGNVVKTKLEQNIKSLLHNPKHIFDIFMISLVDKIENPLWHSSKLRVIIQLV